MTTTHDETPRVDKDDVARYRREAYVSGAREQTRREQAWTPADVPEQPEDPASAPAPAPAKNRRTLGMVAACIAAVILIGVGVAFAYTGAISGNLHEGVDQDLRDGLVHTDLANEPFYLLLLGTDQSAQRDELDEMDGVYRSDSMMLARIDPVQKKVALLSIPRDTMVDLGEHGTQKINAARAFGGPALAVQTVNDLTGVNISHYAEINFDGFQAVVDSIGGVEVDVPMEIDDPDAGGHLAAGTQTLNGEQALILCRARDSYANIVPNPDGMRSANQRMVLSAIARKVLASDPATIANTVSTASHFVATDLELDDIVGVAQAMEGLDPDADVYMATLPTTSEYRYEEPGVAEGYYEIVDKDQWAQMVARMDTGLPPSETAIVDEATGVVLATTGADALDSSAKLASVDVENGTARAGLEDTAKRLLERAGFSNVVAGQINDQFTYPETLVVYSGESRAKEADEIVSALGQGKAMVNDGSYLSDADFLVVIGDDWKDVEVAAKPVAGSSSNAAPPSASTRESGGAR